MSGKLHTIGGHKVLVDEGARLAHPRLRRVDAAAAANLPEQPLASTARRRRIVDVDVVILRRDGLLHERLVEGDAIDLDMVLGLDKFMICGWEDLK